MTPLDWFVLLAYLAGLLGFSAVLARSQRGADDYFVAGRRMHPLPVALSTMATQCSTNSLLGAPAVVAFSAGAGLVWLQYELALPLAMIVLMTVFFPVFRSLNLVSIYDYLERRFGRESRLTVSITFQFLRAFTTGVTIYGVSQVTVICLGIPFWAAVLLLGAVTIVYDVLGGIRAVIWSDVVQLVILFAAILGALWLAVSLAGGPASVFDNVQPERLRALDFSGTGLGDGATFGFWPMVIGGFFLYLAYYGCDQTQAQRELATPGIRQTRTALLLDGLLRFPLVLTYCLLGVALAAFVALHPEFMESPLMLENGEPNINRTVPAFVLTYFPAGLTGLVIAGLFAAAMSSLDSTLNSLSALTIEDILKPVWGQRWTARRELLWSRVLTAAWGVLCVVFSFCVGGIAETIIEAINKVGSVLNGPLLGIFAVGLLWREIGQRAALAGFAAGILANLALWLLAPGVSWLWWNVAGFLVCCAIAGLGAIFAHAANPPLETQWTPSQAGGGQAMGYGLALAGYTGLLLLLLWGFNLLAGRGLE